MLPGASGPLRRRLRPRPGLPVAVPAVLLALLAVRSAAQPAPAGDHPVLRVGASAGLPAERLAEALAVRLGHPVASVGEAVPVGAAWLVELQDGPGGVTLRLRSPDGAIWVRPADAPAEAPETERIRTVALAAEYLLALAESPFVPAGDGPPIPPAVPPPPQVAAATGARPADGIRVTPPAPADGAAPPARVVPGGRLDGTLLLGGASDLSFATRGSSGALVLGLRSELEWPGGLWLLLEAAWHWAGADFVEPLALHQLPVRFGVGGAVQAGRATFRLALQGVFEAWWSTGGTPRSDWRSGGGLVLSGGYRLLPWLAVGGDLGVELLPHGVELLYGDTPVFSLGPWRWRGVVWVSFGSDVGL